MLVGNSNNEIGALEIVFYLDSRVGNEAEDEEISSEYYSVSPVVVNARTTQLYNAVGEVVSSFLAA